MAKEMSEEEKCELPFSIRSRTKASPGRLAVALGIKSPFLIPFIQLFVLLQIVLFIGIGWLLAYAIKSSLKLGRTDYSDGVFTSLLIGLALYSILTKTKFGAKLKKWAKDVSSDEVTFDTNSLTCRQGTQITKIIYSELSAIDYDANAPWNEMNDLIDTLKTTPHGQRRQIIQGLKDTMRKARSRSPFRGGTSLCIKDVNGSELLSLNTDAFDSNEIKTILVQLAKQAPQAKLSRDAEIEVAKYHKTEGALQNVQVTDEDRKIVQDHLAKGKSWQATKYLRESKKLSYGDARALLYKITVR